MTPILSLGEHGAPACKQSLGFTEDEIANMIGEGVDSRRRPTTPRAGSDGLRGAQAPVIMVKGGMHLSSMQHFQKLFEPTR
ncbi:MAG: hypothetical protein NTU41_06220, partial [Chloroflexi bacterium]|nr:hypothetical protein [Chloroflexota bacterium]